MRLPSTQPTPISAPDSMNFPSETTSTARRDRSFVDEGDRPEACVEERVANEQPPRRSPAEDVDLQNHRSGALASRFIQNALNKRGEAEIDDALNGSDVDDGRFLSGQRSAQADDCEQPESQKQRCPAHVRAREAQGEICRRDGDASSRMLRTIPALNRR